jgi:DDE superfamily endonuclease
MVFELRFGATMKGMFRVSEIVFAEGCLPCVVPSRASALSSHRHSWSRLKSLHDKGPLRISCGNEPHWFCSCINNRWCPTSRPRNGYSCICGRCNGGAAGGPWGTFPWKTSQDGVVRRFFPPLDQALVKGVACELVAETQQPLSRQSLADVTARARKALGKPISRSTVWRILDTDAIKPWRYKYWIFPRDPHFAEKAGPILDLYAGMWQGQSLGPKDHILSADEKTSIQARLRCHSSLSPAPGRPSRIEHEYERGGALQYLAAWDVRRGYVIGRCEPTTGIEPFGRLVHQVLSEEPYRSAERLFWIVDNGSSHRGETAKARLQQVDSRIILVHTPVHASWLNQVEIYFSIIQRKVLTPNDFADLEALRLRLAVYEELSNQSPTPFQWRFDRTKLTALLLKIAARQMALADGQLHSLEDAA